MKTFVPIMLAFSGIVLITSVIAQTSTARAQTQENAPSERREPREPPPARPLLRPSPAAIECAPDDRKCEVEQKLGPVNDRLLPAQLPPVPPFDPRKGRGF
jgi:hypothetical protein